MDFLIIIEFIIQQYLIIIAIEVIIQTNFIIKHIMYLLINLNSVIVIINFLLIKIIKTNLQNRLFP